MGELLNKILIVAGLLLVLSCGTADEGSGVLEDNPPAAGTEHGEIDAKLPHLPNTKIDVLGYAVKLRFDHFGETTIPAQVSLEAKLLFASKGVRLHVNGELMSFTKATVDGEDAKFEIVDGKDGAERFGLKGDVLNVKFSAEKAAGNVECTDETSKISYV